MPNLLRWTHHDDEAGKNLGDPIETPRPPNTFGQGAQQNRKGPREGLGGEFDEVRQQLAQLRDEVALLRKIVSVNSGAGAHEALEALNLPKSAVINAADVDGAQHGFYGVERTAGGIAFAWSGPSNQFSFRVAVDRQQGADIRLEAINFIDFDRQRNLKLTADGEPVPVTVSQETLGILITAALTPRPGHEATGLVFTLPATIRPRSTPDPRLLGLAFVRLTANAH